MLNVLKKLSHPQIKSLICLSICMTAFAYGDNKSSVPSKPASKKQEPQKQAPQPSAPTLTPAYNYPARVDTRGEWNTYTEVSFNFWQPSQENMELGQHDKGTNLNISTAGLSITSINSSDVLQAINMNFHFKPGFTIRAGYFLPHDNWDLFAEYTWFHNTNTRSDTATQFVLFDTTSENISPTWGSYVGSEQDVNYESASEKWKLGMDIVDLNLGRWFYVGRKLTFHPSFGIRSTLIRQKAHVSYVYGFTNYPVDLPLLLGSGTLVQNKDVYNTSHSWSIGPKAALETNWMLGLGFSLFANGEADILFTRYTLLKEKTVTEGTVVGLINLIPFDFALADETIGIQNNVNTLRTHVSLELGFDWRTQLFTSQSYIDFSAGYEFQVFFDQNMFRRNVTDPSSFIPNGNLYINGLVARVRIDF